MTLRPSREFKLQRARQRLARKKAEEDRRKFEEENRETLRWLQQLAIAANIVIEVDKKDKKMEPQKNTNPNDAINKVHMAGGGRVKLPPVNRYMQHGCARAIVRDPRKR